MGSENEWLTRTLDLTIRKHDRGVMLGFDQALFWSLILTSYYELLRRYMPQFLLFSELMSGDHRLYWSFNIIDAVEELIRFANV